MIVVIDLEVMTLNAPPLLQDQQASFNSAPQHQHQHGANSSSSSSSSSAVGGGGPSGYGGAQAAAAASASSAYGAYGGAAVTKPVMRSDGMAAATIPIKALNPYSNKWTIKARITTKSDKRSWNNAKGSGTLFSVDLLDSDAGEIRATFFKEACDKFFPVLEQVPPFSLLCSLSLSFFLSLSLFLSLSSSLSLSLSLPLSLHPRTYLFLHIIAP